MKRIIGLTSVICFLSASALFADEPIKVLSCKGKAESYTVAITSEFAPSSKILTNVSMTKFSVNPDGTARIEYETDAPTLDRIFSNRASAMRFFRKNDIVLSADEGTIFVLSLREVTLSVLDMQTRTARKLPCK